MEISAALGAVGQAITIAKAVQAIEKGYDAAVLKSQMADLMNALSDARIALADVKEELADEDAEIVRLRKAFDFRGSLVEVHGYKYEQRSDGTPGGQGRAFCPRCEAVDGRLVRMTSGRRPLDSMCPQCKTEFNDASVMTYPSG